MSGAKWVELNEIAQNKHSSKMLNTKSSWRPQNGSLFFTFEAAVLWFGCRSWAVVTSSYLIPTKFPRKSKPSKRWYSCALILFAKLNRRPVSFTDPLTPTAWKSTLLTHTVQELLDDWYSVRNWEECVRSYAIIIDVKMKAVVGDLLAREICRLQHAISWLARSALSMRNYTDPQTDWWGKH